MADDAGVEATRSKTGTVDEFDRARAEEYALLALLLGRPPSADTLARLRRLHGDSSPIGMAHVALAEAAAIAPAVAQREHFALFIGLGRGELLPYGSFYLSGFLHERPLARLRQDLQRLGIERGEQVTEPEDHIAILCEIMAGLASARLGADAAAERRIFERHLQPWAGRFFADLEASPTARFYRAVGALGRVFIDIEAEAFALAA